LFAKVILMKESAQHYFKHLTEALGKIRCTPKGGADASVFEGVEAVAKLVVARSQAGKKLMFIGNGASASIASHMSTDYWKNGGIRAVAFNDSSLLTCIGNDYGYKHVFEKPIEMFADEGDVLFAVSSSGKSENILRGVEAARSRRCAVVTYSGFKEDNPLRSLGDYNFYVPSPGYGPVEILHLSICHCIIDVIIENRQA
jgi:D-sedoheptulose 7-phosphate isomerase